MSEIMFRLATADDIDIIVHHRSAMFADMGWGTEESRARMNAAFPAWVLPRIQSGEFWTWLACDGERVVAGAGIWEQPWPPGPVDVRPTRAYVYNVYTEVEYRRMGLARQLMNRALEDCRQRGIRTVGLHASQFGRDLYVRLGFVQTNEMILNLD